MVGIQVSGCMERWVKYTAHETPFLYILHFADVNVFFLKENGCILFNITNEYTVPLTFLCILATEKTKEAECRDVPM